jgi:hypothetical protein
LRGGFCLYAEGVIAAPSRQRDNSPSGLRFLQEKGPPGREPPLSALRNGVRPSEFDSQIAVEEEAPSLAGGAHHHLIRFRVRRKLDG